MQDVHINGFVVKFPFEPYDIQKTYMTKVIECLQNGTNGMLESPTGTGKTLSLLCASLAWLDVKKAECQANLQAISVYTQIKLLSDSYQHKSEDDEETESNTESQALSAALKPPRIIFSSRTHTQLTQAIAELRRTHYSYMNVAVLGSRDQLCINAEASQETTAAGKIAKCRTLVKHKQCSYFLNVERGCTEGFDQDILDIEDLVDIGRELRTCPYYVTKSLKQKADIIFMPYNYLLDPRVRKAHDVALKNCVVILDEGHNVEKMCEESASYTITSSDIGTAISEVTECRLITTSQSAMHMKDIICVLNRCAGLFQYSWYHVGYLDERMAKVPNPSKYAFDNVSSDMCARCESAPIIVCSWCQSALCVQNFLIDYHACDKYAPKIIKAISSLEECGMTKFLPEDFQSQALPPLKQTLLALQTSIGGIALSRNDDAKFPGEFIFDLLEKAGITHSNYSQLLTLIPKVAEYLKFLNGSYEIPRFIKAGIQQTGFGLFSLVNLLEIVFYMDKCSFEEHRKNVRDSYRIYVTSERQKGLISFLNPVGTSGKMVNFWCFNPAFGMKRLLNQGVHSIIITSGTLSPLQPLISELEIPIKVTLENAHVISGGQVYAGVVTTGPDGTQLNSSYRTREDPAYRKSLGQTVLNTCRIVPHGLLVFFPSYSLLEACRAAWVRTGAWSAINACKEIFIEPKDKHEMKIVMDKYNKKIVEPDSKGACFLAVCRGKVAEGLDFIDHFGRGVIITGLPYPPCFDPRVEMKKAYLDISKKEVTGSQWYTLEGTRAVNQAIGRVIRHRNDYGVILFCDIRFSDLRLRDNFSRWLRPQINVHHNFGSLPRVLALFFKNARETLPQPDIKPIEPRKPRIFLDKGDISIPTPFSASSIGSLISNAVSNAAMNAHSSFASSYDSHCKTDVPDEDEVSVIDLDSSSDLELELPPFTLKPVSDLPPFALKPVSELPPFTLDPVSELPPFTLDPVTGILSAPSLSGIDVVVPNEGSTIHTDSDLHPPYYLAPVVDLAGDEAQNYTEVILIEGVNVTDSDDVAHAASPKRSRIEIKGAPISSELQV